MLRQHRRLSVGLTLVLALTAACGMLDRTPPTATPLPTPDATARQLSVFEAEGRAQQRGLLPVPAHGWHGQLDQVCGSFEVWGGQRMADRVGRRAVLRVPRARAPMQRRNKIRLLILQMGPEHIGKQMVIAIPEAPVVQRNHKKVAAL